MTLPAQDIVERLRNADANSQQRVLGSRIFGEAADTISRLTADNETLRKDVDFFKEQFDDQVVSREASESRADALAQEVERLKAEKENLQDVLQAAHDALKRDIPAKAFHAVRAAIRALANEEAGR